MFEIGADYSRSDLLHFVGSRQRQSGIVWGPKEPGCVIITSGGRHSQTVGYEDECLPDGSWDYFGQGEKGDQDVALFANNLLIEGQRSVLLFTTREPTAQEVRARGSFAKQYRFQGHFLVERWEWFSPTNGSRVGDRLIKFHLVRARDHFDYQEVAPNRQMNNAVSLSQLRSTLRDRNVPYLVSRSSREFRRASTQIKQYARLRANGVCENCDRHAPFCDAACLPFLEVHHICRLADDGPDIPENVAAVCPNCHREAHLGRDRDLFRKTLRDRILLKESHIDGSSISS